MRLQVVLLVLALARSAGADPPVYEVGGDLGAQLTLLGGADLLPRFVVAGSRRWQDRWEAGLRAGFELGEGMTGDVRIVAVEAELGVWLHATPKLDVLLAWRFGYAGLWLDVARVGAVVIEPAAVLAFHVRRDLEVRVAPVVVTGYRSGLWQVTLGPEVGLAWRL